MGTPYLPTKTQMGKYLVEDFLGNGAFGTVFKVINEYGQQFALKCMYKDRFSEANGKLGELAYNEVKALKNIRNDYVVKFIDSFDFVYQEKTLFCIVLEFCDGGDLQTYLEKNWSSFTKEDAIRLLQQILSGMKELHAQRIIHRDLKLPNILMHQGKIKLADFGFCHILSDQQSKIIGSLGSLGTSAPEVLDNQQYGLQSDMFSIGVIFYLMLFRKYPFSPYSRETFFDQVKNNNPPNYTVNGRTIEQKIEKILTKMLKFDPKERLEWHALFRTSLFEGSISQIFVSSKIQNETEIVDPIQSYIFYKRQMLNQLMESIPLVIQKTMNPIAYIELLLNVYELINKINHSQVLAGLFPSFLILKLIFSKQKEANYIEKQSTKELQNGIHNQPKQQNKLNFYLDIESTHINLVYQQQVIWANFKKLLHHKFALENQKQEILTLQLSQYFMKNFKEILRNYLNYLYKEIDENCLQNQITIQNLLPESDYNTNSQTNCVSFIYEKVKLAVLIYKIEQQEGNIQIDLEQLQEPLILINQYINKQP